MRVELRPHPDFPCQAVERLEAEVARTPAGLELRYVLEGRLGDVALPALESPLRTDDLWRHTCFEAFVGGAGEGYAEFNFAPSSRWAAYRFDGYRSGMAPLEVVPSQIDIRKAADRLEIAVTLPFDAPADARLNLTAVVEEASGRISYWALAHPAGRPDFHDPDCLVLHLP